MGKRIIFSDLHFGDPACSLRQEQVAVGLRKFLRRQSPIDELILAGDILDANVASLSRAIYGAKGARKWSGQIGLRKWLSHLFEQDAKGKALEVGRIVYLPGNHDYVIWNVLATNRVFVDPISKGHQPTNLPLMEDEFNDPFIKGAAPASMQDHFVVIYPDYEFDLARRSVLVTHGHYLDHKQTLLNDLPTLIREAGGEEKKAVRKFFIGAAQYQQVANAVSFTSQTRNFVDRTHKAISGLVSVFGQLRNQPIDASLLAAIEMYLVYFRKKDPDVFIFGHTHDAGRTANDAFARTVKKRLIKKKIEVLNTGSFLDSRSHQSRAGTFVITDDSLNKKDMIKLYEMDVNGNLAII